MKGVLPSQTIGPYFAGILDERLQTLVTAATRGERIRVEGVVRDGDGTPVPDAMVEIWQANAAGRYAHPRDSREDVPLDPAFAGYGRSGTDDDGRYWFETIKPGRVPHPKGGLQAPHLLVTVFARGLLNHLCTRVYFEDEAATAKDPILELVPPQRRPTLIASRVAAASKPVYRFDIKLQGPAATETVYFRF